MRKCEAAGMSAAPGRLHLRKLSEELRTQWEAQALLTPPDYEFGTVVRSRLWRGVGKQQGLHRNCLSPVNLRRLGCHHRSVLCLAHLTGTSAWR
jgi:hypothetical protein